jgi:hypothetical protein
MSIITRPKRWSSKPPVGTQINWGSPLSQGLFESFLLNENGGLVARSFDNFAAGFAGGGPYWISTPAGIGVSSPGTSNRISIPNRINYAAGDFTARYISIQYGTIGGGFSDLLAKGTVAAGELQLFTSTSGDLSQIVVGAQDLSGVTGAFTLNVPTDLVITRRGTSLKVYVNGILKSTQTSTGTTGFAGTMSLGGNGFRGTGEPNQTILGWQFWQRELSAGEVSQLYVDPYCFLQPQTGNKRYYIPTPPLVRLGGRLSESNKISGLTYTTASVTGTSGNSLILSLCHDFTTVSSVVWNNGSQAFTKDNEIANSTLISTSIWSLHNITGGSGTITITFGASIASKAVSVSEVSGLAPSGAKDQAPTGATGSSATPSTGTTATTSTANEYIHAAIGTEGPDADTAGSWTTGAGNTDLNDQRKGTTGGAASSNVTISEAYEIQTATGTWSGAKTGITSRAWAGVMVTYKTSTGNLFTQTLSSVMSGFAASRLTNTNKSVPATTAQMSGSMTKASRKNIASVMAACSATLSKLSSKSISAVTASFAGSLSPSRFFTKVLSAVTAGFAGNVSRTTLKALSASTASMSASITKRTTRVLNAATAAMSGSTSKFTKHVLNAVTSVMSGSVAGVRVIIKTFSASMSAMSASVVRQAQKQISATSASMAGSITKSTAKKLTAASAGFAATITKLSTRFLTAVTATMSGSVGVSKAFLKSFAAATAGFAGTITKKTSHNESAATAGFTGVISRAATFLRSFAAITAGFAGTTTKSTKRSINAVMSSMTGSTVKSTRKALTAATASMAATLSRRTTKVFTAITSPFVGSTSKYTKKSIVAAMAPMAGVAKTPIGQAFQAVMSGFDAVLTYIRSNRPLNKQPGRTLMVKADNRTLSVEAQTRHIKVPRGK